MALTIVATVGSATANSYGTLAEFSTYIDTRLNITAYSGSTDDLRNRSLVEAARELQVLTYVGTRVDTTQSLPWPREFAPNPDQPSDVTAVTDVYYLTTEIPDRMKRGQFELALAFLKGGTTDIASLDTSRNIKREEIGGAIETEYVDVAQRVEQLARFPAVMREIRALLVNSGSRAVIRS